MHGSADANRAHDCRPHVGTSTLRQLIVTVSADETGNHGSAQRKRSRVRPCSARDARAEGETLTGKTYGF
jgi:hypothetical protein